MAENCIDCQSEDCFPCNECGCPDVEVCDCPTAPEYTSSNCPVPMNASCVAFDGEPDTCAEITVLPSMKLTTVIKKILTYVKSVFDRITPADASITISPVDDACEDKATIKVNISEDIGNSLELKPNGLYVPDIDVLEGECYTVEKEVNEGVKTFKIVIDKECLFEDLPSDNICDVFTENLNQANGTDLNTYKFAAIMSFEEGCQGALIEPPTGFGIVGRNLTLDVNRQSAFGNIEWFESLTLANAAATEGETVLIYQNTIEEITLKKNVNYQGIGFPSIGTISLTLATTADGTNRLNNINLVDGFICHNNAINKVFCTNVRIGGVSSLSGSVKWDGGYFIESASPTQLHLNSRLTNFVSEKPIYLIENATADFGVISVLVDAPYALSLYPTVGTHTKASHITVHAPGILNAGARFHSAGGAVTASHITVNTVSSIGVYAHNGGNDTSGGDVNERALNLSYISAFSIDGDAFWAVANFDGSDIVSTRKPNINFCNAYSVNGRGFYLINGDLKQCNGYSVNNNACQINGTEDGFGHNTVLMECTMESSTKSALTASGDIYISGGTYITNSDLYSPIIIGIGSTEHKHYFIDGIKTIQKNPSLYSINALAPISARISNNSFLCQDLAFNVPGINTTFITPRAVIIDAFNNIT